jgi:hypothetical protein
MTVGFRFARRGFKPPISLSGGLACRRCNYGNRELSLELADERKFLDSVCLRAENTFFSCPFRLQGKLPENTLILRKTSASFDMNMK